MKSLSTFITESRHSIYDDMLLRAEPELKRLVNMIEQAEIDAGHAPMTAWARKMTELQLTADLLMAMSKHVLPSDELVDATFRYDKKGLAIRSTIIRDTQTYYFNTFAIGAGGHNIQRYHYRYLTETNLPKIKPVKPQELIDKENAIKRMSKAEKINKEIESYKEQIAKREAEIANLKAMSDEELLELSDTWKLYKDVTWDEIIRRGADKNYDYSEDVYNKKKTEARAESLAFMKSMRDRSDDMVILWQKSIAKLEKKLEAYL